MPILPMKIQKKDEKYIKSKIRLINADIGGIAMGAYIAGKMGSKLTTAGRREIMKDITKMVYQIYRKGKKSI